MVGIRKGSMKKLDKYLQNERIKRVKPFIQNNSLVLDIGCFDGVLFRQIESQIQFGYGIDPLLEKEIKNEKYYLLPGKFPEDLPKGIGPFDVITALAVFEHISPEVQLSFADACRHYLTPGGRVIITVPSNYVDKILDFLLRVGLVDGMAVEQHHDFNPTLTTAIFAQAGFKIEYKRKFQLGLNNLFVFQRT
jgi:2-polyprenyl-3-methyl-5-hydroxy-6-metoxy-1,4-benzoquinol methylase